MPTVSATSIRAASQGAGAFGVTAERLRRAGDFAGAIDLCRQGLAQHPGHVGARVTLGLSLMATGRDDEAFSALAEALRLAPDNLAAIRGLAELHERGVGGDTVDPSMFDLAEAPDVSPAPVPVPAPVELHRAVGLAVPPAVAAVADDLTSPVEPAFVPLDPVVSLESFETLGPDLIGDSDPFGAPGGVFAAPEEAPVAAVAMAVADETMPPAAVMLDVPAPTELDPVVSLDAFDALDSLDALGADPIAEADPLFVLSGASASADALPVVPLALEQAVSPVAVTPEPVVADEFDLATAFAEPAASPVMPSVLAVDAPALAAAHEIAVPSPAPPDPFAGLRLDDLDPELPADDSVSLADDFSLEDVVSALDPAVAPVAALSPAEPVLRLVAAPVTMAPTPDVPTPHAQTSATTGVPGLHASVIVQASIVVQGAVGAAPLQAATAGPDATLGPAPAEATDAAVVQAPLVVPPAPAAAAQVMVAAAVSTQPVAVLTDGPAAVLEEWLTRIHTRRKQILSEYAAS